MITGVFFLLLGLSILIKILFKIDIPVFRALVSIFLIYLGVRMLTGTFGLSGLFEWKDRSSVVFSEGHFHAGRGDTEGEQSHYSIVFGKGVVDLTELAARKDGPRDIEVNVVFGEGVIVIDPKAAVHVVSNAVFGESRMPDDNQVVFGTLNYRTAAATEGSDNVIHVRTNVVFGSIRIKQKSPPEAAPDSASSPADKQREKSKGKAEEESEEE